MPPAKSTLSKLRTLLKSSTSTKVHDCLLDTLETASDTELEALAALLAPLSTQSSSKKHCVRCHLAYTENTNHSAACKIKHSDDEGETEYETGTDTGITTLYCCGFSFDAEHEREPEFCISASHTTNVDDVHYYELDGDEYTVNTNVVRCEVNGCSKKRKVAVAKTVGNKGGSARKKQKSI